MSARLDSRLLRFTFCVVGMVAGLSIDAEQGRLATLNALCMGSESSVRTGLQLHWQQLPAMHGGMLLSSMFAFFPFAIPGESRQLSVNALRHTACFMFMFAGMYLGTLLHLLWGLGASTPSMLLCMTAGMACGMKAGEWLTWPSSGHNRRTS